MLALLFHPGLAANLVLYDVNCPRCFDMFFRVETLHIQPPPLQKNIRPYDPTKLLQTWRVWCYKWQRRWTKNEFDTEFHSHGTGKSPCFGCKWMVFIIIGNRKSEGVRQGFYLVPTVPDPKLQVEISTKDCLPSVFACSKDRYMHLPEESVKIISTISRMICIKCNWSQFLASNREIHIHDSVWCEITFAVATFFAWRSGNNMATPAENVSMPLPKQMCLKLPYCNSMIPWLLLLSLNMTISHCTPSISAINSPNPSSLCNPAFFVYTCKVWMCSPFASEFAFACNCCAVGLSNRKPGDAPERGDVGETDSWLERSCP